MRQSKGSISRFVDLATDLVSASRKRSLQTQRGEQAPALNYELFVQERKIASPTKKSASCNLLSSNVMI